MEKEMKKMNHHDIKKTPFSDYAKFCMNLKGLQLKMGLTHLDKWEAFPGFDNSVEILAGLTKIDFHKKSIL